MAINKDIALEVREAKERLPTNGERPAKMFATAPNSQNDQSSIQHVGPTQDCLNEVKKLDQGSPGLIHEGSNMTCMQDQRSGKKRCMYDQESVIKASALTQDLSKSAEG